MKPRKYNLRQELILLLLGALGFSRAGHFLLMDGLGLPLSLMEVYYIPLLIYWRRPILRFVRHRLTRATRCQTLLWTLLVSGLAAGLVRTLQWSFLTEYRSMLYLLIVFGMVRRSERTIPVMVIQRVALYTVVSELLYIVVCSADEISSSVNCVAIAAAILAAFLCERYLLGMVSFALGAFLGIVSGFRIGIVVAALALVESVIFVLLRRDKQGSARVMLRRWAVVASFAVVVVVFLNFWQPIITTVARWTGMSDFAVFRVTVRLEGLLKMDMAAAQEGTRLMIFRYPLERFLQSLLPRGLIGSLTGEYWLYIDVPILYLYDIFGSLAAWGMLGWFGARVLAAMKLLFRRLPEGLEHSLDSFRLLCLLLSPVMLCLLIVNGSFIVITFQAVQNAVLLGGLCRTPQKSLTLSPSPAKEACPCVTQPDPIG